MYKRMGLIASIFLGAFLTIAHAADEPNREEIIKAIKEYIPTQSAICIPYPSNAILLDDSRDEIIFQNNQMDSIYAKKLAFLAQKGLFKEYKENNKAGEGTVTYYPIEALKPYLFEEHISVMTRRFICTGRVELESIVNIEPKLTDNHVEDDREVYRVEYSVKLKNIAHWAVDPQFLTLYSYKDNNIRSIVLVKMKGENKFLPYRHLFI